MLKFTSTVPRVKFRWLSNMVSILFLSFDPSLHKSRDSTKVEGLPIVSFFFPNQIYFLCSPGLRAIPFCCFFLKQYCNKLGNKSLESVSSRKILLGNGILEIFSGRKFCMSRVMKKNLFRKCWRGPRDIELYVDTWLGKRMECS